MARSPPTFALDAVREMGVGYPDQELIAAIVGRRIDPKDLSRHDRERPVLFSAAHGSEIRAWRFVSEANQAEKDKGHLYGFPISVSPPIYPGAYSPTGAVFKKKR